MYENGLRGRESGSFFCHTLSGVMCVPFLLYTPKCQMSHTWLGGLTLFSGHTGVIPGYECRAFSVIHFLVSDVSHLVRRVDFFSGHTLSGVIPGQECHTFSVIRS